MTDNEQQIQRAMRAIASDTHTIANALMSVRHDEQARQLVNAGALSFRDQCAIAAIGAFVKRIGQNVTQYHVTTSFNLADWMEAERKKRTK